MFFELSENSDYLVRSFRPQAAKSEGIEFARVAGFPRVPGSWQNQPELASYAALDCARLADLKKRIS